MKTFVLSNYREGNFEAVTANGEQYHSTIRSTSCELLTESKDILIFGINPTKKEKCKNCKQYGYALTKRMKRIKERNFKVNQRKFSHTNFKHKDITREELCLKLKEQKEEINDLTHKVWKLKRQFDNSTRKDGFKVNEHANAELKSLMASCSDEFKRGFPDTNSRQRLFLEQQELFASKVDNCGMRWHPMIIKWCLFLRQKSQAAYAAMKESCFINLPSSRTLYDYSHFLKSELGFQRDVFKLASLEVEKKGLYEEEWRKNVGPLFDEIKIREDFVYDKHTGELIGHCNLGDIANQMMAFDVSQTDTGHEMAKQVLVVMMRFEFSLVCF